jgi:hypothetical protein
VFTGFVKEDFKAFAKYKIGFEKYNDERKKVWNKMKVLMNEINHGLYQNRDIYVRPYKVSPYWPSARKREVHCIWLPYGPPNRVGKHGYTYQIYPHISLGIFYDRFEIDFLIPDMAERYGGRYQSKFLTLILKDRHMIKDSLLQLLKSTHRKMLYFGFNDALVELRHRTFLTDFEQAVKNIEPTRIGKDWIIISCELERDHVIKLKGKIVELAVSSIRILSPLVRAVVDSESFDRQLIKLLFPKSQSHPKNSPKRVRRTQRKKEIKYVEELIPKLPEYGFSVLGQECEFPTGDKVDLILSYNKNRIAVAEVETEVGKNDKKGFLQSLKYRALMSGILGKPLHEIKALLISKRIHKTIKTLCEKFDVAWMEIKV